MATNERIDDPGALTIDFCKQIALLRLFLVRTQDFNPSL